MPSRARAFCRPPVGRAAVVQACVHQWAVTLDDVMRRRTSWHYYHADAHAIARQAAGWMGEVFGWDAARQAVELERYFHLSNDQRTV